MHRRPPTGSSYEGTAEHEIAVREFFASVDPIRRARVAAKYPVLSARTLGRRRDREVPLEDAAIPGMAAALDGSQLRPCAAVRVPDRANAA